MNFYTVDFRLPFSYTTEADIAKWQQMYKHGVLHTWFQAKKEWGIKKLPDVYIHAYPVHVSNPDKVVINDPLEIAVELYSSILPHYTMRTKEIVNHKLYNVVVPFNVATMCEAVRELKRHYPNLIINQDY